MAEAQFASLNGTAVYAATVDDGEFDLHFAPNPNALARRSISIFSRRGTETPEPKPPFIAQAAMAKTPNPKREMSERQKSWLGRRKSVCGSSGQTKAQPAKPKGTILNAVPPANIIKMSALEEEMATSPNDEILSAISEQSPTHMAFTARSHLPSESPNAGSGFWNKSNMSLAQRTKSEKKQEKNSRIGLWVNGVAQWDDHLQLRAPDHGRWVEEAIEEETGFTVLHHTVAGGPGDSGVRPRLSVVIPNGQEPRINTKALSTIVQPHPRRSMVSVAPASIVSKFNITTPTITVEEPHEEHYVSPLDSTQPTLPQQEQHNDSSRLDVLDASANVRPKASRESSGSSSSELLEHDANSSVYSNLSSATSVESLRIALPKRSSKRLSGRVLSSAPRALVDTEAEHVEVTANLNKPLPPNPIPLPPRSAPAPPSISVRRKRVGSSGSTKSVPSSRSSTMQPERPMITKTRSLMNLDKLDAEFVRSSPYAQVHKQCDVPDLSDAEASTSPTLSQAEDELHAVLSGIADDVLSYEVAMKEVGVAKSTSVKRKDSVRSVMQPPERAPTVPRRSRKREWRAPRKQEVQSAQPTRTLSASGTQQSTRHVPFVRRSVSAAHVGNAPCLIQDTHASSEHTEVIAVPLPPPRIFVDDGLVVVQGPVIMDQSFEERRAVAAASAEDVLLHILAALRTIDDLFSTAMVNKGMYRVYKENELHLIRTVSFNQSPAAWEFREWCPPERNQSYCSSKASSQLEHTPASYTRCSRRDMATIESLKSLILAQCQTFIRRETVFALSTPLHSNAQRFNDAFWRIFCFCKIFGCEKGREDDVTGQLDWLKGGLLANNQGFSATVNTNLDFEMSSVLLNAPDFFAKGNASGLSAQQLYDMTELWTCLSSLLQGYQGRVEQARSAGVFDAVNDLAEDDVERQEGLLEEWTYHLLTLGPSVVLEMAKYANDTGFAGFALAKLNGWTKWTPPTYSGSRGTFLKEPVARLYEERIAAAASAMQNPTQREKKEMSRKRVATLAAEIRLKRQTSTYKRSPYIDMSMERPMSVASRRNSTTSTRSNRSVISPLTATQYASPTAFSPTSAPNFSHPHPSSAGYGTAWSPRKISPIIEERVVSFNRLSLQNFAGVAEDTGDRAVKKIVEMGFTTTQAKDALRVTDMGDGLRVDRAVDLLLRQRS